MKGVSAQIGLLVSFSFHIFYVLPIPDDWQKGNNDWVPVQKECISCKKSRSTKDQITQESQDPISRVLVPPPAKSFASPQLSNNNNKQFRFLQQNSSPAQQFPYQFVENKPAFGSFPQSQKTSFSGFPTYDPLKNIYPLDNGQLLQTNPFIKFPGNSAPSQGKYIQMFAFPQPYQFPPSNQLIPSTVNQFPSAKNQFPLPSNQFHNQFQSANNPFLTPTNRFQNTNSQFQLIGNPFVTPTNPFPFGKPFQFDQPNFQQPSQQSNLFQPQLISNTIPTTSPKKVSSSTQKIKLQETSTPKSTNYSPVKNIQQSYPNEEIQLLYVPVETINQKNRNNKNIKNANSVTQSTTPSVKITEPHRFQSPPSGNFPISSTAFNTNIGFGPTFNSFTDVPVHNNNFKFPGENSPGLLQQTKFQEASGIPKIPNFSKQQQFYDQNIQQTPDFQQQEKYTEPHINPKLKFSEAHSHHQTQNFQQQEKFTEPNSDQQLYKFSEPHSHQQIPDFQKQQNFKESDEYVRKPDFQSQQTKANELSDSLNTQQQPTFLQQNFQSKPSKLHDTKNSEQNLLLVKNPPQFYPDPTINTFPNPTYPNFVSTANFQHNQSHPVLMGEPTPYDFSSEHNADNSQNAINPSVQTFHSDSVKIPQQILTTTANIVEQTEAQQHADTEPLIPSFKGTILQPQVNSQQDIAWYDIPAMEKAEEEFQKQKTNKPFRISTTVTTPIITTESSTLPPPYQPPLSIYMDKNSESQSDDILELLKAAKTIPVIDTVEGKPPIIFIGPSELSTPSGYRKYELPYLSSLDTNRLERMVDPFFVAPLNFKPPSGYIKIIFPPPHIGSVVVSNGINPFKELHEKLEHSTKISTQHTTNKIRSTTPAPSNRKAEVTSTTQLYRTRPSTSTQNLPSSSTTTSKNNRRRKPIHRGFNSTTSAPQTIESVEEYVQKTSPLPTTKTYLKFDDYIIKQTTIPQEETPEQRTELYYTNSPKYFTDNLVEPRFPLHSIQNTSDNAFTAVPASDISLSPTYDNFVDAIPSSIPVTSTNKVSGNFNHVKSISQFINSYGGDVTAPSSDENIPQWPTISQFNLSTIANFDKDSQSSNDFQPQFTTQPPYLQEEEIKSKNDAANSKVEKLYNSNIITNTDTSNGLDSKVQSSNEFQSQYNHQNSAPNNHKDNISSNESYLKDAYNASVQDYHDTYSSINHKETPITSNDNKNKYSTEYSYVKETNNEFIKNSPSEENYTDELKTQVYKDSPHSYSTDQANVPEQNTRFYNEYSYTHSPSDESYIKDKKPQINKFHSQIENSQYDGHYPNENKIENENLKPVDTISSTSPTQLIHENYATSNLETTSTFDSSFYPEKSELPTYSPSLDKEIELSQDNHNGTTSSQDNAQHNYPTYSQKDSPSSQNVKQSETPLNKYEEPSFGFTSEEVTSFIPDARSSESSSSQESSTSSEALSSLSQKPFTSSQEQFTNSQEPSPTTHETSSTTHDYTRRHKNRQRYRHRYSTSSTEIYDNVDPSTRRSYYRKPTEDDVSSTTRGHRRRRPLKLSTTTEAEKSYDTEISSSTTEYVSSSTTSSRPTETTIEVTTHRLFKPRTRPTPDHLTSEADKPPTSTEFTRSTTAEAPSSIEQIFESTSHRSFKPRIRTTPENSRFKFNRRTTTTTTESPTDSIPPSAPSSNEVITQDEKKTTEYSDISSPSDVIPTSETSQRQYVSSETPQPQDVTSETSERHDSSNETSQRQYSSSETSIRHDVSTYSNDPLEENVILNMLPRSYNYSGKQSRNMQIVYPMNVDASQRDHFTTNDDPKNSNVIEKEHDNRKKEFDVNSDEKKVHHHRRKGTWVRKIRVKKPQDVLETAESQNLGHSKNAIRTIVRKTKTTTTEIPSSTSVEPEVIEEPNPGFSDMFAEMFGEYSTEKPLEKLKFDGKVTSENSDFYTSEKNGEVFINSNTPDELVLEKEIEKLSSSENDNNEKLSSYVNSNSANIEGQNDDENEGHFSRGNKENWKPTARKIESAFRNRGKNNDKKLSQELPKKTSDESSSEKNEFKLEYPIDETFSVKSVDTDDHSSKKNESDDQSFNQQENSNEGELAANSDDQNSNIQETHETQTQRESNEQDIDQNRDAQSNGHSVGDYVENDSNKRENNSQIHSDERQTNENKDSSEHESESIEKGDDSNNEQYEKINETNSNEEATTEQPNSEIIKSESTQEKILTSTTTEISLETEICYKGRCVKTKKTKATDLIPTE